MNFETVNPSIYKLPNIRPDIILKINSAIQWLLSRSWSVNIDFIILYGSVALGFHRPGSDIDIVIGITKNQEYLMRINKEIVLSRPYDDLDIRLFYHLPIYIQKSALQGVILYCKDLTYLYDLAYETLKKYESFKPYLDDYTGAVLLP